MSISRVVEIRAGKHASAADFSSTPGSLIALEPDSHGFMPPDRRRIRRSFASLDNRRLADIVGPVDLAPCALVVPVRGASVSAGAAFDPETATELGVLFDCVFGAASVDPASTGTTATGGNGATPNITVTSGTNYVDGMAILFDTDTGTFAREIVSGGGTGTLVLDRTYTGTPTGTVHRLAHWDATPANSEHVHAYFDVEGEDWRRIYAGCMSSLDLDMKEADVVKASFSWLPTNVTDSADANPSHTAPTAGSYIVNVNGDLRIGNASFLARDLKFSLGASPVARPSIQGPQGVSGYVVPNLDECKLTGRFYLGDNASSLGEIVDDSGTPSLDSLQGGNTVGALPTTRDVAVQIGTIAGACLYLRIRAAEFRAKIVDVDGQPCVDFTAYATRPTTGAIATLHLG